MWYCIIIPKTIKRNIKNRLIIVNKGNAFYKQKVLVSTQYKKHSKLTSEDTKVADKFFVTITSTLGSKADLDRASGCGVDAEIKENFHTYVFFLVALRPNTANGHIIHKVSRSHMTTHNSWLDSSERVTSSSQISLTDNTQHSQETDRRVPGGIRNHNLSWRPATNRRLKVRLHRKRSAAAGRPSRENAAVCDLVTPYTARQPKAVQCEKRPSS
jgi:hypothetical protein